LARCELRHESLAQTPVAHRQLFDAQLIERGLDDRDTAHDEVGAPRLQAWQGRPSRDIQRVQAPPLALDGRAREHVALHACRVVLGQAEVQRGGFLGRGSVRRLELQAGGESFTGRFRRGELELTPRLPATAWTERLLVALSREAAGDADVRRAVSRSGWALRQ